MNKIILNAKIMVIALTVGLVSVSPNEVRADELQRLAENLCEYAKTDNRASMRKKLRSASLRLKEIYPNLICGSAGTLMRVAVASDSMNAAKFIASKAGKRSLTIVEKDGKTVLEYTQGLVASGDATKQPFVDLIKNRI